MHLHKRQSRRTTRFPGQFVQWSGDVREVCNEGPIIGSKAAESSHFRHIRGTWPICYGVDFVRIAFDALFADDMSKKGDLPLEQMTFGSLQLQCMTIETVENCG